MRKFLHIIITVTIMVTFLIGCGCDSRHDKLNAIDSLADVQPDSALSLLKSMSKEMESASEATNMYYRLLLMKSKDKNDLCITKDSDIIDILGYYKEGHDNSKLPMAYYYAGRYYRENGDAPQAMECFLESYHLTMPKERKPGLLGQIGNLFLEQFYYNESLKYFIEETERSKELKDTASIINSYLDLVYAYYNLEQREKALQYCREAHDYSVEFSDKCLLPVTNCQLALLLYKSNLVQEAIPYINDALKKRNEQNPTDRRATLGTALEIYYSIGRTDSCSQYLDELAQYDHIYNRELYYKFKTFGAIDKKDNISAKDYIDEYFGVLDTIMSISENKSVKKVEQQFNYNILKKRADKAIAEKKKMNTFWIITVFLIFVITLLIIYRIRVRYKKRTTLNNQLKHIADSSTLSKDLIKTLQGRESYNKICNAISNECKNPITETDWNDLFADIDEVHPEIKEKINNLCKTSTQEYKICILTILNFSPSEIARVTFHSAASITMARERMYRKAFGKDGKAADWDYVIRNL